MNLKKKAVVSGTNEKKKVIRIPMGWHDDKIGSRRRTKGKTLKRRTILEEEKLDKAGTFQAMSMFCLNNAGEVILCTCLGKKKGAAFCGGTTSKEERDLQ